LDIHVYVLQRNLNIEMCFVWLIGFSLSLKMLY
jgi:hypothetical protein